MTRAGSTWRSVAVWWLVTVTLAAGAFPAGGALAAARTSSHDFAVLLGALAAGVALASGAWLWWCTTWMVLGVLRGRPLRPRGCPEVWRRLVLAGCGVGLVGALAAPVHAAEQSREEVATTLDVRRVAALPLPDRAAGHAGRRSSTPVPTTDVIVVRAGDTLWGLAESRLPAGASDAAIASYAARWHLRNLAVIGEDPDLIRPGQRLVVPPASATGEDDR